MKLWERFLYAGALLSLVLLLFIFSTHHSDELSSSSEASAQLFATISPNTYNVANNDIQAENDNEESVDVSPQDALHIINGYYRIQSQHKELAEEEERLLQEISESGTKTDSRQNLLSAVAKPKEDIFKLIEHKVAKGDSLWSIARKYDVPLYTVESANPSLKNKMIFVGENIRVPNQKGILYKVQKGNSLSQIASRYKADIDKIKKVNGLNGNEIFAKQELFLPDANPLPQTYYKNVKMFQMPLKGRITSPFGYRIHPIYKRRAFHYGIDIGAAKGTSIKAAADGVVIFAGNGGTYGNLVILKHKYNYMTLYAHCSRLYKKKGDYVKQGEKIAAVGTTGVSTGPHLHFEVKYKRKSINPQTALKKTIEVAYQR